MTPLVLLAVGAAGALGAAARFAVDGAVASRAGRDFPLGTFAVNLSGAIALGAIVGATVSGDGLRIAGTGLIGGYTTFSTWALESQRLGEDGQLGLGALNFVLSLLLGLAALWLGRHLGGAL
ncbi:MAG: fluoride efflux transporter CrcB [Thermoleophilaceae bacterium]